MIGADPIINTTPPTKGHFHGVRFYDSDKSLCRIVAQFIGEGLAVRQPALVIATAEHRRGILDELHARHFDIVRMHAAGDMVMLDARKLMSTFIVDGVPDPELFTANATRALARVNRGRKDVTVRAYGELVDLLWKDGFDAAAIQVEMMWNRLARSQAFSLLCGYSMGSFYKDACVASICEEHTHVVAPDGTAIFRAAGTLMVGALPETV
jgi:MEDS: MEthanogen/methylotroph, DcmR Sensory domain